MMIQKGLYNDFYLNIFKEYAQKDKDIESDLFNIYTIRVFYIDQESNREDNSSRCYKITRVECISNLDTIEFQRLQSFTTTLSKQLENNAYSKDGAWQLFYLYKSIFQFTKEYNYFRGQSNNYSLKPGILRDITSDKYLAEFEDKYKELAKEYPTKLTYYSLSQYDDRECELSLLQHYGLPTSLLDITSNVYIAMLFMLGQTFGPKNIPSLFLFNIDTKVHNEHHLFSTVKKSALNERINAQHGAFFNFDKLSRLQFGSVHRSKKRIQRGLYKKIKKVDTIKIELCFDGIAFDAEIKEELKLIEELKAVTSNSDEEALKIQAEAVQVRSSQLIAIKRDTLEYIRIELNRKLSEYGYVEQDLYPDFENRLVHIRDSYPKRTANQLHI